MNMKFDDDEVNPMTYGALLQRMNDMDKKIDKMGGQLEELVALANRPRGGFWIGMSIISTLSAIAGFVVSNSKDTINH